MITNPEYMPKNLQILIQILIGYFTPKSLGSWPLNLTGQTCNAKWVVFEGQALVAFPLLSQVASSTPDRAQSHIRGSSLLLQHPAMLSWQPPCESNYFCHPFQEMQKLEIRKGRQPSVYLPGTKDPSWSQAETGFLVNTLLNMVLLLPKVDKVITVCTAFRVKWDLTINHLI